MTPKHYGIGLSLMSKMMRYSSPSYSNLFLLFEHSMWWKLWCEPLEYCKHICSALGSSFCTWFRPNLIPTVTEIVSDPIS